MNGRALEEILSDLPLGGVRYYERVGSTNDVALQWALAGAPHLALVVADEQIAGRGRLNRIWFTPPGAALAFSVFICPDEIRLEQGAVARISGLGALAICESINQILPADCPAQIKWPNDVIVARRKLAGVLVESHWQADDLQAIILGIGINVAPDSIPSGEQLHFPATCIQAVTERPVDRWVLLSEVLAQMLQWLPRVASAEFIRAWERRLAFQGERVLAHFDAQPPLEGKIAGLNQDGSLRFRALTGEERTLQFGEIMLRPVDRMRK